MFMCFVLTLLNVLTESLHQNKNKKNKNFLSVFDGSALIYTVDNTNVIFTNRFKEVS